MNEKDNIKKKIIDLGKVQPWNHNYILGDGIETSPGKQKSHGKNLIKLGRLESILECIGLKEKAVLDVGCNEGFFSMHMANEGAKVLGVDIDQNRIEKAKFIQTLMGSGKNVQFENLDIYSKDFRDLPKFDLCLCLGFIHRVPDPFTAIASLVDRTNMIVFEWKALKFGPHDESFCYFSQKSIDEQDYYGTEYWLLSYSAVESILKRQGFNYFHRVDDPRQRRAILVAGRNPHPIFNQKDIVMHRGRIPTIFSHGKRAIKSFVKIMTGKLNA